MALTFSKHEKLSLRTHPQFNEAWLHDRICEDPSILGLGDLRILARERAYANAGRLDLLLVDDANDRRFEVEVMLGATDPSHIIRTIEYWDIERRRYPAYEHVAVLIAESVTTRFLNVMSLLAGSIPLVAIQLDALRVGSSVVLNFVPVLDQTELRLDDEDEGSSEDQPADRAYWDKKAGQQLMATCDKMLSIINEVADPKQEPNHLRGYIGLRSNGIVRNFVWFSPKPTPQFVFVGVRTQQGAELQPRLEAAGIDVRLKRKQLHLRVTPAELGKNEPLIREVLHAATIEARS
jgi:hypothetical protein